MGTLVGTAGFDADVRAILGAISTDLLPTATLLRFTNAAYIEDICLKFDPLELRTSATPSTTLNTRTFTPAISNCLRLTAIQNAAGQVLKEITPEIESPYAVPIAAMTAPNAPLTGVPTAYIRVGGAAYTTLSFALYPVPAGVYPLTVYYVQRPAEITASTATAIDALWDQAIVYYSASRSAAYLRMYDDAMKLRDYALVLAKNVASSLALPVSGADNAVPPAGGQ